MDQFYPRKRHDTPALREYSGTQLLEPLREEYAVCMVASNVLHKSCRRCRTADIRPSHRRWYDHALGLVGLLPYRCLSCESRFYRFRT
jgi:hypothetical protein